MTLTEHFSLQQVEDPIKEDVGYYCCHYEGVTDCLNDTENADSTYVYLKKGKGTTDIQRLLLTLINTAAIV